jgi:hypothetical protein
MCLHADNSHVPGEGPAVRLRSCYVSGGESRGFGDWNQAITPEVTPFPCSSDRQVFASILMYLTSMPANWFTSDRRTRPPNSSGPE